MLPVLRNPSSNPSHGLLLLPKIPTNNGIEIFDVFGCGCNVLLSESQPASITYGSAAHQREKLISISNNGPQN